MADTEDVLASGIYSIRPWNTGEYDDNGNPLVWDVSGRSKSNGAAIQLYSPDATYSNHQLVHFCAPSTLPSKYGKKLEFLHSGSMADINQNARTDKTKIIQHTVNTDSNSQWFSVRKTTDYGTCAHNGVEIYPWRLYAYNKGTSTQSAYFRVALTDSGGYPLSAYSKIVLRDYSLEFSELWDAWALFRDSYHVTSLPVPSDIGLSLDTDGQRLKSIGVKSTDEYLYPGWLCASHDYQVRWRRRWRYKRTGAPWMAWSDWYAPNVAFSESSDEARADMGWGNGWAKNTEDSAVTMSKHGEWSVGGSTVGIPVPSAWTYLSADITWQYEVEVRSWTTDSTLTARYGMGHGTSCVQRIEVYKAPEVTVSSVTLSPDGVSIAYSCNLTADNNTIRIQDAMCEGFQLFDDREFSDCPHAGTLTVPLSALKQLPSDEDSVSFTLEYEMSDGMEADTAYTGNIEYGSGGTLSLKASMSASGYDVLVTVGAGGTFANFGAFLVYRRRGRLVSEQCAWEFGKTFTVNPPFNSTDWQVIVFAKLQSSSTWGCQKLQGIEIKTYDSVFDFGDDRAVVHIYEDRFGYDSYKRKAESASYGFSGAEFEETYFNSFAEGEVELEGVCLTGAHTQFDRLLQAHYATLRTPRGYRCRVAVTEVENEPNEKGYESVKVKMVESA